MADLKTLLTEAGETIPSKANKPDLIAKIIGSAAATSKYDEIYGGGTPAAPLPALAEPAVSTPAAQPLPATATIRAVRASLPSSSRFLTQFTKRLHQPLRKLCSALRVQTNKCADKFISVPAAVPAQVAKV